MIYRIDRKHFLTHAIDYFTLEEITHMQYAIISASVHAGGKCQNMSKINDLYPPVDAIEAYESYKDKDMFEKMYFGFLEPDEEDKIRMKRGQSYFVYNKIYKVFINPLVQHNDILIICDEAENVYIDVLCKYLKKKFDIEVIDLNKLFKTGHIGPIYIDRDEILDKAVDIRRSCARDQIEDLTSTPDGRAKLIGMMTKKEKLKKLREFGIDPSDEDKKNIDEILLKVWNDEMEEED